MNMTDKNKKISIFKNLWQKRVPQTLGIYLGTSWAIIEFISSLLVDRYLLSPHLIDFSIVVLLSLIPSVLMIAYFHGKPGKDKWTRFEKIGIPTNIVFSLILLFFVFNGKDLGATTKTITFENEEGEKIERVIPKSNFRKKISTFPFENESADSTYNWLQYGLEFALNFDLSQDLFFQCSTIYQSNMLGVYTILEKLNRYGFPDGIKVPFTLKKKIAQESYMDYFFSGSFTTSNDTLFIKTLLYETKRGKLIAKNSFKGTDIFKLTDEMSLQLKKDLEISPHLLEETKDLPVAEMLTNSIPSFRMYITGLSMLFDNDYEKATDKLEQVIEEDPTFALAYFSLTGLYTFSNKVKKIEKSVHSAMQNIYKLPEQYKFMVKIQYYSSKHEVEKVIALVKMRIELYPEDISAYKLLALFLKSKNLIDEEIEAYKGILKIDPTQFEVLKKIGSLYEEKGKFDKALKHYKQYADQFPEDSSSYTAIGDLYKSYGNYQQAKAFYEKAILFEPEKISILISLANIEEKTGNFQKALEQYENSLNLCKTPRDLAEVYLALSSYYETRGQINKSLEYSYKELNECEKFQSPFVVIFGKFGYLKKYVQIGKKELAFQSIETMKTQLSTPFDQFISVANLKIYIELEDTDKIKKEIENVEILMKTFGSEMFHHLIFDAKGKIYEIKKEFEQAILMYQKELELKPTEIDINRKIGSCYRKMKEFKKAGKYLQKTLNILPFNPGINYELALLYNDMGKMEKALEHLNIALDIWKDADPEYIPAQKAREKLRVWEEK